MMIAPKCFDPDTWKVWKYLANINRIDLRWYCRDCTPEYKASMCKAKRCAHPETVFGWMGKKNDIEYVGVPKHIKYRIKKN